MDWLSMDHVRNPKKHVRNGRAAFSTLSVPRGYRKDKEDRLNLAVVKLATVHVTKLPAV
jgi:hypothetical protein